jgi:diguanylate cyclase (GGDEF)-like protein
VEMRGVTRDIGDRKQMEMALREMATTDFLTGISNRRHFIAQMELELARVGRLSAARAAVLMLDLDYFKGDNDRFGHATGDTMLKHVVGLMRKELRRIDTAGRVGGEEFAIILPGADLAGAKVFAERLRLKVAQTPLVQEGQTIPITVSIGIAALSGADADAALDRADKALYRAKKAGRDRVELESNSPS